MQGKRARWLRVLEPVSIVYVALPFAIFLFGWLKLWIALPVTSEIAVFDLSSGELVKVFSLASPEKTAVTETIDARIEAGESWLELLTPPLWEPAPGAMTGMILSPNDGTVYVSGLGDAIMRLER